jgi:hypothetical protein
MAAIEALGENGGTDAVTALAANLASELRDVRAAAALALAATVIARGLFAAAGPEHPRDQPAGEGRLQTALDRIDPMCLASGRCRPPPPLADSRCPRP